MRNNRQDRFFRPKGLSIYRVRAGGLSLDGGPRFELAASIKSRGRTGAAARSRFPSDSHDQTQRILKDWKRGHSADLPEPLAYVLHARAKGTRPLCRPGWELPFGAQRFAGEFGRAPTCNDCQREIWKAEQRRPRRAA